MKQRLSLSYLHAVALCAGLSSLSGCGGDDGGKIKAPPLGLVKGTVKLDGQPLPKAQVEFVPAAARASVGWTDDKGAYTLNYDQSKKGAAVGEHTVRITTKIEAGPSKETVPAKYNVQSELKKTVKEGENSIDFDLQSK